MPGRAKSCPPRPRSSSSSSRSSRSPRRSPRRSTKRRSPRRSTKRRTKSAPGPLRHEAEVSPASRPRESRGCRRQMEG